MDGLSDSSSSTSIALHEDQTPTMPSSPRQALLGVLHWICSGLLFLLAFYLIVLSLSTDTKPLFALHPIFMSIAFLVVFPQAIVLFNGDQYKTVNHKQRVQLHLYCQIAGAVCATIGFGAVYLNKNIAGKSHFVSYHGLAGLCVMIVVLLVFIGGILTNYSFKLRNFIRPVLVKIFHSSGGILTIIIGNLTCILGLYSHWFTRNGMPSLLYPIFIVIILSTFLVLRRSVVTLKERVLSTFVRNNL